MRSGWKRFGVALILCALWPMAHSLDVGRDDMNKQPLEKGSFETSAGPLEITFVGHGTLMVTFGGKVVHIDPVMREADYTKMPDADLVLITHGHQDHLDAKALAAIRKEGTQIVGPPHVADSVKNVTVMQNGDTKTVMGLSIEAVAAYNVKHKRPSGAPFHPKGWGNGYVVACGDKRVYIAGDTEDIPEMTSLKDIDIAFLPMNLPYTMTPAMAARAARAFRPRILYPYHFGQTDPKELVALLKDEAGIEVRVRRLD